MYKQQKQIVFLMILLALCAALSACTPEAPSVWTPIHGEDQTEARTLMEITEPRLSETVSSTAAPEPTLCPSGQTEPAAETEEASEEPREQTQTPADTESPDTSEFPAEPSDRGIPEVTAASGPQETEEQSQLRYIANTSTKKFHLPDCGSVSDMKESNKLYFTGTREELIEQGYVPCKRCNP